jgi:hypothetical protein
MHFRSTIVYVYVCIYLARGREFMTIDETKMSKGKEAKEQIDQQTSYSSGMHMNRTEECN